MPKLNVARLRMATHPGGEKARPVRILDGAGLYLQIAAGGTKSWLFRFTLNGRAREMGLGAADPDGRNGVSLAEARQLASDAQRELGAGLDPIQERQRRNQERVQAETAREDHSFRKAAEGLIAKERPGWKSAKHADQWNATLETYVFPTLGAMDVADIEVAHVVSVLQPIWERIPETASRVRQRIEAVMSYAAAPSRRWCSTDNPARWRDVLEHELTEISQIRNQQHWPSLPWQQIGDFMKALDKHQGVGAQVVKLLIFTACRSGEARKATWNEIDLEKAVWTLPARRKKGKKLHRIGLSRPAIKVLEGARLQSAGKPDDLVFPSRASGKAVSDMTLSELIKGMSLDGLEPGQHPRWRDGENRAVVPHGFRATFKSWALSAGYPDHLSEIALSHSDRNKVREAYAREDMLEERRPMMEAWGEVCS